MDAPIPNPRVSPEEANVDPQTLTPDMVDQFANQPATGQREPLSRRLPDGAGRLRAGRLAPPVPNHGPSPGPQQNNTANGSEDSKDYDEVAEDGSDNDEDEDDDGDGEEGGIPIERVFPNVDNDDEVAENNDDSQFAHLSASQRHVLEERRLAERAFERERHWFMDQGVEEEEKGDYKEMVGHFDFKHATGWEPASLFRKGATRKQSPVPLGSWPSFSLVVLNQPLGHSATLQRLWGNARIHVAADGGANCLFEAGPAKGEHLFDDLDVIIGDLDSLRDDVRAYFTSPPRHADIVHNPDQNSTDFGKAVSHLRATPSHMGPADIVVLGGLGGRVDQGLSQLHHLYHFHQKWGYGRGRVYLVSEESVTFLLAEGSHRIRVREPCGLLGAEEEVFGKHVGIIPIREPSVISTWGLEWDVREWKTEFGGQMSTSNHVLPETEVVRVSTTKAVLFTIAVKPINMAAQ